MEKAKSNLSLSRFATLVHHWKKKDHSLVTQGGTVYDISRAAFSVRGISHLVSLGDIVVTGYGKDCIRGEIIRLNKEHVLVKPYNDITLPELGASVFPCGQLQISPDISWRGRVINALGEVLDSGPPLLHGEYSFPIENIAPPALQRRRVGEKFSTGVNVIDIFTPLCFGQRIGIFSGSGVGKSTLLGMMARADHFDTVILALTGERGREVRDMLDGTLKDAREKVITVVATSDESPMMRRMAPIVATAIAEYFSSRGDNVLLMIDSITRYALAVREISIAAGEPPVSRGFPPSVFSQLPRLLERAGPGNEGRGSITGIYTVLIDGDDHNDPIADAIRGALDGHIVLNRAIAAQGRFPAVDIPSSISRLSPLCWTSQQRQVVQHLKEMIVRFEETRDLRAMGAYKEGADPFLDQAVQFVPKIYEAMQQMPEAPINLDPYISLASTLKLQTHM